MAKHMVNNEKQGQVPMDTTTNIQIQEGTNQAIASETEETIP